MSQDPAPSGTFDHVLSAEARGEHLALARVASSRIARGESGVLLDEPRDLAA